MINSTIMKQNTKSISLLISLILFPFFASYSQNDIPTESWRRHFSYRSVNQIVNTNTLIYAISNNGVFEYDKEANSIKTLGKKDGLSETSASYIAYQKAKGRTLIAYKSGGYDLIEGNNIYKINSFKIAPINGSKTAKHIYFKDNFAYVATDLGLVVIDCEKKIVKEIYDNLGLNGANLQINTSIVFSDSLFLGTNMGLISAPFNKGLNLKDFNSWSTHSTSFSETEIGIKDILAVNKTLILRNSNDLFQYTSGVFTKISTNINSESRIKTYNNKIYWTNNNQIHSLDGTSEEIETVPNAKKLVDIFIDENNIHWLADLENGMISNLDGTYKNYFPSGPWNGYTNKLYGIENQIYGLGKGNNGDEAFYIFNHSSLWENFNEAITPQMKNLGLDKNFSSIKKNLTNNNTYISSFTDGLIEFNKEKNVFKNLKAEAGNLVSDNGEFKISDTEIDAKGNLWAIFENSNQLLAKRDINGNWTSYLTNYSASLKPKKVIIAPNNDKWIIPEFGLLVFNELSGKHYQSSSNLSGAKVTDLIFDKENTDVLWISTLKGFGQVYNATYSLEENSFLFEKPVHEGREVFPDEKFNCIAIDGGNRKWLGTDKGAYLFDENGEVNLRHFTKENSILPSDTIVDIEINHKSGEVFFSTKLGLVSYRSDASTASIDQEKTLKIFPNPVRPNFQGVVTISQLTNNANVKILDANGIKVYETTSNGGTVSWNLKDNAGNKVNTGMYQVLVSSENGENVGSGYLAIIK